MISTLLSVTTILLCVIMKAPQIIRIYNQKQTGGISLTSLLLDLINLSTTACYNYTNNYALLSYMEYPIILIQQYILIGIILFYNNRLNTKVYMLTMLYVGVLSAFVGGILPASILMFLVPFGTPLSLSSKFIQLYTILKFKNADNISLTTWVISAFTNGARIYTILVDSADKMLLTNVSLNTALSTSILLTSIFYKQYSGKRV